MKKRIFIGSMSASLALTGLAYGTPIVDLGDYTLPSNSSQTIAINVTDSGDASLEEIEGMTFTLQISGGTGTTPSISSIDFLTGSIWSGHVSAFDVTPAAGASPQFQSFSLITDNFGDFVNANGVLANVTFNTTGAATGDYTLKLVGTTDPGSDSAFINGIGNPVTSTFGSGILTISSSVPEPASLGLAAVGVIALGVRRRAAK